MNNLLRRLFPWFFLSRPPAAVNPAHEAKEMRQHLTEGQIDKTIADSFPASDPPSWY